VSEESEGSPSLLECECRALDPFRSCRRIDEEVGRIGPRYDGVEWKQTRLEDRVDAVLLKVDTFDLGLAKAAAAERDSER